MDAQTIDVSRILFGFAAAFHYLFVPLTIGLAALIAILDAFALATRRFEFTRAGDYWTRLLLINFVCGLLTGWPLRLLIEQQWTRYAQAVGEVFGWVFALEGRIAPFLFTLAWRWPSAIGCRRPCGCWSARCWPPSWWRSPAPS